METFTGSQFDPDVRFGRPASSVDPRVRAIESLVESRTSRSLLRRGAYIDHSDQTNSPARSASSSAAPWA
ncbi:MAG: hypothetical protein M3285_13795, partial [Actinomycetota bacterium]|nr:hypothetical protein [Actinomycetota bacterium]